MYVRHTTTVEWFCVGSLQFALPYAVRSSRHVYSGVTEYSVFSLRTVYVRLDYLGLNIPAGKLS